ncbi:MAG: hypothetical protein ACE5EM_11005 [Sphingomonadales bacterium]
MKAMRFADVALAILLATTTGALAGGKEDLEAGWRHLKDGAFEAGIESVTKALRTGDLSHNQRGAGFFLRSMGFQATGEKDKALADLGAAIQFMNDPSAALGRRIALAWSLGKKDISFNDLTRLAWGFPEKAGKIRARFVWSVIKWLEEQDRKQDVFQLLSALTDANYSGGVPGSSGDYFLVKYVELLIERGRLVQAVALVNRMKLAKPLLQMSIDRRYERLWRMPQFIAATDPAGLAARELAFYEEARQANPDHLNPVLVYLGGLRLSGQSEKAVAVAKEALADLERFKKDKEDEFWLINELAYALVEIGRVEEGNSLMRDLAARSLDENPDLVNQFINRGALLLDQGRFEEAMEAAKQAESDYVSPYGLGFVRGIEACALHELGMRRKSMRIVEEMLETAADNYPAVMEVLLCLDQLDRAAEIMIQRLDDPKHRETALLALMQYAPSPNEQPLQRKLQSRLHAVRDRADVMAKIKQVGRLIEVPMVSGYWGTY